MKTSLTFPTLLLLFAISSFAVSSCSKEPNVISNLEINSGARGGSNLDLLISNNENYLSVLGKYVAFMSSNGDWKNSVYKGVETKIDGDYNVLLEDMFDPSFSKSATFTNILNQTLSKHKEDVGIDFFEALSQYRDNKIKYTRITYPQIFIPNYEELKKRGIIGSKNPTIFIYNSFRKAEDRKEGSFPSYAVDEKGQLMNIASVNEEYAKNNEVWVISINERIKSQESYAKLRKKSNNSGARLYGFSPDLNSVASNCSDNNDQLIAPNVSTGYRLNIYAIQVYSHHEPWYSGASEIAVRLASVWGNGKRQTYPYDSYNTTSQDDGSVLWLGGSDSRYNDAPTDGNSNEFIAVSRNQVGRDANQYIPNINYNASWDNRYPNWGQQNDPRGDCMYYTFYEEDTVGSDGQVLIVSYPAIGPATNVSNQYTMPVHSNEPPYGSGYIYFYTNPDCFITTVYNDIRIDWQLRTPF